MVQQELQLVTKETQKVVLKALCENPTLSIEDLSLSLKGHGKSVTPEEINQVLLSIAPNKNWSRTTAEETRKEILNYLWILEAQILFLFPTKQKETTLAEFNQLRLRNKQTKVSKDLIRHLQTILLVDGKNLAKFRKFEKDLNILDDVDSATQGTWAMRIVLAVLELDQVSTVQQLSSLTQEKFREAFPLLAEKVGKTLQRISEKLIERYFPKDISGSELKELVAKYQSIFKTYKQGTEVEVGIQKEYQDQNKVIDSIIEELSEVKSLVTESHEGGFVSKLISGKVKNKEGVIGRVERAIEMLKELAHLSNVVNQASLDKALLVQKLQTDYESILITKNQLENDLFNIKEDLKSLQEKKVSLDNELKDTRESLERAHEKIATLQQIVDTIPEHQTKENMLREELNTAKDLSLRLYRRLGKLKSDIQRLNLEKERLEKDLVSAKSHLHPVVVNSQIRSRETEKQEAEKKEVENL